MAGTSAQATKRWWESNPQAQHERAGLAALALVFVLAKVLAIWGVGPQHRGDEKMWPRVGALPLLEAEFWSARRPFTVPLIHKLVGLSEGWVVWVQCGLAVVGWLAFAHQLSRWGSSLASRVTAFVLVLLLALSSAVHGWDVVMRSESASLSFMALVMAGALGLVRAAREQRPHAARIHCAAAAVAAVFAAFSRDTNGYSLVTFGLFTLAAVWVLERERFRYRGLALALAGLLMVLLALSTTNQEASGRYQNPLMNVIFRRVLPDQEKLAYFTNELRMPADSAVMSRKGKRVHDDNRFASVSPEMASFRAWLERDGYSGYQRYLLSHFPSTLAEATRAFPAIASLQLEQYVTAAAGPLNRASNVLLAWARLAPRAAVIALLALAAIGFVALRGNGRLLAALVGLFIANTVLQAYVAYHGDSTEVERHGLTGAIFLQLAMLVAIVVVVEAQTGASRDDDATLFALARHVLGGRAMRGVRATRWCLAPARRVRPKRSWAAASSCPWSCAPGAMVRRLRQPSCAKLCCASRHTRRRTDYWQQVAAPPPD